MNIKILFSALGLTAVISAVMAPTNAMNRQSRITEAQLKELNHKAAREIEIAESLRAKYIDKLAARVDEDDISIAKLAYKSQAAKALTIVAIFAKHAAQSTEETAEDYQRHIIKLSPSINPYINFTDFEAPEWCWIASMQIEKMLKLIAEEIKEVLVGREEMRPADEALEVAVQRKEIADMQLQYVYSALREVMTILPREEVAKEEIKLEKANIITYITELRLAGAQTRRQADIAKIAARLL